MEYSLMEARLILAVFRAYSAEMINRREYCRDGGLATEENPWLVGQGWIVQSGTWFAERSGVEYPLFSVAEKGLELLSVVGLIDAEKKVCEENPSSYAKRHFFNLLAEIEKPIREFEEREITDRVIKRVKRNPIIRDSLAGFPSGYQVPPRQWSAKTCDWLVKNDIIRFENHLGYRMLMCCLTDRGKTVVAALGE